MISRRWKLRRRAGPVLWGATCGACGWAYFEAETEAAINRRSDEHVAGCSKWPDEEPGSPVRICEFFRKPSAKELEALRDSAAVAAAELASRIGY